MKRASKSHGLFIASVVFGAFGFANFAATFGGDEPSDPTRLTVAIESPTGESSLLTYRQGTGWRFEDEPRHKTLNASAISSARAAEPKAVTQPLSVLVDGPTGYTYVWVADKGWKFVGHVVAGSR